MTQARAGPETERVPVNVSSQPVSRSDEIRMAPGTRLGSFEILALLGRGGMGEVYHARDTRLGRDVALKVVSAEGIEDGQHLVRFEQEARLVAALNHPNIASLYGIHEADEIVCLVFELVPGLTLQEILKGGPLELEPALRLARQIADALHAAREQSIVHRDLKPSNVMVTPEGSVKVLDFGLAQGPLGGPIGGSSSFPTASLPMTREGRLVGTPWYMSPEQLRGQAVDAQTDLWAFGCLLFEMLAGVRAFEAETLSDTIAAILEREPDWQRLPAETPPRVRTLLARCLNKERRGRLHHAGDARIEIDETLAELRAPVAQPRPRSARHLALGRRALPWVVAALSLAVSLALALGSRTETRSPARLHINLPATAPLALDRRPALALAPDGQRLVYVAARGNGTQLCLRRLDQLDVTPIPGTEGGDSPTFSPDGEWLAFAAGGKLKKVRLTGSPPVTLADAPALHGVTWAANGRLYFAPSSVSGIASVPADGGAVDTVTSPDAQKGEAAHRWPYALPGGRGLLYTVQGAEGDSLETARIAALSLDTGERRLVIEGGTFPSYTPTGHLLYARAGRLLAVPFDLGRLEARGPAVPIADEVTVSPLSGAAQLACSPNGLCVYAPGGPQAVARSLLWVTRDGSTRPAAEARRAYFGPRLSPDGRRIALAVEDDKGFDLWIQEVERDALMRLTSDPGNERLPAWTPDGRRLVFSAAAADRPPSLLVKPADGSGEAHALIKSGHGQVPGSLSPDGRSLAFTEEDPAPGGTGEDIWVLPLDGHGTPLAFLRTPFDEAGPVFSPDGHWLAFTSNETGRVEVYVRPFPGPGGKWQISTEGGDEPRWSPDGGEIFFRSAGKMMAAAVQSAVGFKAGKPVILFEDAYDRGLAGYANYDVLGKAPRFLMVRSEPRPAPTQLNVVLDWFSELERGGPGPRRTP